MTKEVSASTGAVPSGTVVGTITMTVYTTKGTQGVAAFIDRVSKVSGLYALWVSSTTKTAGETMIQATAQITAAAFSTRATALPGGNS